MMEQQLKQRIAYLVEHGGIAEDPLTEVQRSVQLNRRIAFLALAVAAANLLVTAVHAA
jgi:hypothetical protein